MSVHGESHLRSILKTLSWRFLATIITMSVAFFVFDDVEKALQVGVLDTLIKLFIYYGHERLWAKIGIGKELTPEYEI